MDAREQLERRLADPAALSAEALADLALDALDFGLFEAIVERIERALAAGAASARLYQLLGLARRGLLDGAAAVAAFERAARLAPADALIAHGLARSTWEAGLPSVKRYEQALRLAPTDAGVLLGHAAALVSAERGDEAEAALVRLLTANPGWLDGHAAYARMIPTIRAAADCTATIRPALARHPDDPALWRVLLRLLLDARRHPEAVARARDAAARLGDAEEWRRAEAVALGEQGEAAVAQRLFDGLPPASTSAGVVAPLRNLIRLGRLAEASALAERRFPDAGESVLWPYRALLWRLAGDARWEWLEGDPSLVGIYDLGLSPAELTALAETLRALHRRSGTFLDQSVRGGTQTDGNLLARAESELRPVRAALLDAIDTHVAQFAPACAGHPTLIERRSPVRITGSWSVRLADAGFHIDHIHPHGWLSSACYITLPDAPGSDPHAGWLAFGECRDLLPGLNGFRLVEPKPGRLVLFPSTMWHGTRPFAAGERLTVAFDVARP